MHSLRVFCQVVDVGAKWDPLAFLIINWISHNIWPMIFLDKRKAKLALVAGHILSC